MIFFIISCCANKRCWVWQTRGCSKAWWVFRWQILIIEKGKEVPSAVTWGNITRLSSTSVHLVIVLRMWASHRELMKWECTLPMCSHLTNDQQDNHVESSVLIKMIHKLTFWKKLIRIFLDWGYFSWHTFWINISPFAFAEFSADLSNVLVTWAAIPQHYISLVLPLYAALLVFSLSCISGGC